MYAVMALVGLMLLTWVVAVWASWSDDMTEIHGQTTGEKAMLRKVA
jgi:hypothetical protein